MECSTDYTVSISDAQQLISLSFSARNRSSSATPAFCSNFPLIFDRKSAYFSKHFLKMADSFLDAYPGLRRYVLSDVELTDNIVGGAYDMGQLIDDMVTQLQFIKQQLTRKEAELTRAEETIRREQWQIQEMRQQVN